MKQILLTLLVLFLSQFAFAQISKNQWLVGGSGNLSFKRSTFDSFKGAKNNTFSIRPNVGYFFLNRLAAGIRLGYDVSVTKGYYDNGIAQKLQSHSISLSPFVRYYILSESHRINVLADAAYGRTWNVQKNNNGKSEYGSNAYSFAAGPVWFINPTAALELSLNFIHNNDNIYNSDVTVNVGFQLHFGKPKKK